MRRLAGRRGLLLTLALALLLGVGSGFAFRQAGHGDQLTIGRTGDTLSAVLRLDDRLIVFGGGDARTDLTDLVGRATLPWARRIDLLVVPGWDSRQATGALGLVEHGGVRAVAILGPAAEHPAWRLLEQAAAAHGIEVSYLDGESDLSLGGNAALHFSAAPAAGTPLPAALLRVRSGELDLLLADIDPAADLKRLGGWEALPTDTQLLVASRPVDTALVRAQLVVRPAALRASQVGDLAPRYVAELRPGEQLRVDLRDGRARLPLERLTPQYATPPR